MRETTRVTITLPTEQVEALKKMTDNVSGWVAEATADRMRGQVVDEDLARHEREHGPFTEEELAAAFRALYGSAPAQSDQRASADPGMRRDAA
ncbi:hypothetical protein AB0J21_09805 [Streptomyces sp. NPDC049954]|uniref:hypothetical protein n=1 Tax=Streptomyces sp. NPDC049954 TaxID=3155779 RepID=UPI003435949C